METVYLILFIVAASIIALYLLGQGVIGIIVGRILYFHHLVRRKPEEWGRRCSDPDDYEQHLMWDQGLEWGKENEQYRKAKRDTKFGRLIDGTEYGKYAIDNEFLLDDSSFIGPRSAAAKFYSTIVLNGRCYGVWLDRKAGEVFMSKAYDPSNPCIFTFTLADHKAGTIYAKARNSAWFIPVIEAFKQGKLTFEDQKIKHAFIDVIRRCMI